MVSLIPCWTRGHVVDVGVKLDSSPTGTCLVGLNYGFVAAGAALGLSPFDLVPLSSNPESRNCSC